MLLAIAFGAGWMLWGAGLASAPIIIHLLSRRKFKRMTWAAMPWLQAAMKKNRRRLLFEQWLLLAVRTLVVLLVALAMSRPTLDAAVSLLPIATTATHHIIVIDNTLSMQHSAGNASRMERARATAHAILDDAPKGDLASLVVAGISPQVVVGDPSPYLDAVGKEVDQLRPQHGSARMAGAIEAVEKILAKSRSSKRRIYFLTDLQKHAWTAPDTVSQSELAARLRKFSDSAACYVIDSGSGVAGNLAVTKLESTVPIATRATPMVWRATVTNHSEESRSGVRVELAVDGQVESAETVTLGPREEKTVSLQSVFAEPGEKVVEARVAGDGLRQDDARRAVVRVRDAVKVLLIDGQPSLEEYRSETDYVYEALNPDREGLPGYFFRPAVRPESELLEAGLDRYDLVVACNVSRWSPNEVAAAEDFVARGGGLLLFLGSQVKLDRWNETLVKDGSGLLPVRLAKLITEREMGGQPAALDPLGYRHPVVAEFRGNEEAGLLSPRFRSYVKVEPLGKTAIDPVLNFSTGDPAVLMSSFGRGKVALVTTSADLDWSGWPLAPSYPPVLQELAIRLIAGRQRPGAARVGDPVSWPIGRSGLTVAGTVTGPGPDPIVDAIRAEVKEGTSTVTIPRTDLTGVYRAEFTEPNPDVWSFAINPDPVESDLTALKAEDLRSLYPGWEVSVLAEWSGGGFLGQSGSAGIAEMAPTLLYLALLLLLLETGMAWWFTHHRG